jgi:hypothetical protein
MSVASVTIDSGAWGDPRIQRLARLLGYPDPDFALIKLAKLWARCIYLGTDIPGDVEIQACLDDRGPELLVLCGLGEELEEGIRVKGRITEEGKDRIGWFRQRHPSNEPPTSESNPRGKAKGGAVRANGAPRAGGRFVKSTTNDAGDQQPPANRDAGENAGGDSTSIFPDAGPSGSGSGSEEEKSPARVGNAGDAGDQQRPATSNAGGNAGASNLPYRPLGRVLEAIWIYGQKKHLELRDSGIDRHAQAWSAGPTGTGDTDLRHRIREMQERGKSDDEIITAGKHVIDVRAAEAKGFQPPHLRYFIASRTFTAEAWSKASELSPAQAAAQAAQKNGARPSTPPRPTEPPPRRSTPLKPC